MKPFNLLLIGMLLISSAIFAQEKENSEIIMNNILERKSVRTYSDRKVEKEDLEKLLRAAMAAPTAMNSQPWVFIVIDKKETLESLGEQLPYAGMLKEAQAAIIVCGDMKKALDGEAREYWVQDCSAATENILLAAESMGLGAVWTGVYPIKERINIVKVEMKLPENIIPLNVIPIGWQTGKEKAKQKYSEENIYWNKCEER
jgi:nitroreductase